MRNIATAVCAYVATRWRDLRGQSRAQIERRQDRKIEAFLASKIRRVAFYREREASKFADLPVIDKSLLMNDFESFNTAGIDVETGWKIFEGSKVLGRYTIGASTGTSGNRGLFVISDIERHRWLGVILAKALPGFWCRHERVAVILPLNTPLYDTANQRRLLQVSFFDLTEGPVSWRADLEKFDPTVIVAPPKILRWFANERGSLAPQKIFSAAETLEPLDRKVIERAFGLRLGQIYMATEGLLAVSCKEGTLHLCEDTMHFEVEPVGDGLVSPIITDFSRETQIMARYRMNDLLRLSDESCPCGSGLQAVAEVVGRMDDCFQLKTLDGADVMLTPDVIRNAVIDANRSIHDYRVVQRTEVDVDLVLPNGTSVEAADSALQALRSLFEKHAAAVNIKSSTQTLELYPTHKLRRVESRYGGNDV